jgi:hypothetical protein
VPEPNGLERDRTVDGNPLSLDESDARPRVDSDRMGNDLLFNDFDFDHGHLSLSALITDTYILTSDGPEVKTFL